ncbi:hypothetical protein PV326_007928 [Microctonus aethiopoides]|nr:hypothetical protein PV326_007928 [Microctonus aethiopoides]
MLDASFSEKEVEEGLNSLARGKAPGEDGGGDAGWMGEHGHCINPQEWREVQGQQLQRDITDGHGLQGVDLDNGEENRYVGRGDQSPERKSGWFQEGERHKGAHLYAQRIGLSGQEAAHE